MRPGWPTWQPMRAAHQPTPRWRPGWPRPVTRPPSPTRSGGRCGQPPESYIQYLTSGAFVEATFENWESEFLQMGAYVLLTAFLIQKGSPESKNPDGDQVDQDPRTQRDDPDAPGPVKRGGLVLALYEHSLSLALFGLGAFSLRRQDRPSCP
jgi:hypothetical protein